VFFWTDGVGCQLRRKYLKSEVWNVHCKECRSGQFVTNISQESNHSILQMDAACSAKLHGVTSKKAITLIELSDEAAVHWGSDRTKHRHCWQSVRCVRQGFRLRPINDRQGKPTSYIQIKPVAQSCSGIIKGQSKVLKLLARSSVNYTASVISIIITGGYQWNYSGKILEDLWLFASVPSCVLLD
jgi:hypothetical protein